jgi:hypothetical protein
LVPYLNFHYGGSLRSCDVHGLHNPCHPPTMTLAIGVYHILQRHPLHPSSTTSLHTAISPPPPGRPKYTAKSTSSVVQSNRLQSTTCPSPTTRSTIALTTQAPLPPKMAAPQYYELYRRSRYVRSVSFTSCDLGVLEEEGPFPIHSTP